MTDEIKITFSIGDRVQLSSLGRARSPRLRVFCGTVKGLGRSNNYFYVVLDGQTSMTQLHRSYIEPISIDGDCGSKVSL
jgi:hypothetical protein